MTMSRLAGSGVVVGVRKGLTDNVGAMLQLNVASRAFVAGVSGRF